MCSSDLFSSFTLNYVESSVEKFITEWKGVPYKFGGKTKKGIDCSKLTQRFYKDVYNINIPEVCWKQWNYTKRIQKDSLQEGDLVFFNSKRSPSGWHVGIYLGNNLFLHAPKKHDVVKISSLNDSNYKKAFKGAGRVIKPNNTI